MWHPSAPLRRSDPGLLWEYAKRPIGAIYKLAHTHGQDPANVALSGWTWSNRTIQVAATPGATDGGCNRIYALSSLPRASRGE